MGALIATSDRGTGQTNCLPRLRCTCRTFAQPFACISTGSTGLLNGELVSYLAWEATSRRSVLAPTITYEPKTPVSLQLSLNDLLLTFMKDC